MARFDNKVVVITGAGGGIGRCHALAFAAGGASVVVNDLGSARDGAGADASMAEMVAREIREKGGRAAASHDSVATQAGAEAIIQAALREFGGVDVLVNNAGILRDKTLVKMPEEMWDIVIQVHLKGSFLCLQAAARAMIERGRGGRIINTSSYAGLKGNFGQANYGSAKAGIYGLTVVAALELAPRGITVNAVAPLAKTRMTEDVSVIPDEMRPEQVSPMVLYLASDEAAGVTGRVFGTHGGHLFEYKMTTTEGIQRAEPWTVEAIGAAMPAIEGSGAPAPAPQAAPAAPPPAAPAVRAAPETPAERVAFIFENMALGFLPEKAKKWKAVMHWQIAGAGDFTVTAGDGAAATSKGVAGSPTCVVKTDRDTFLGIFDNRIDANQAYMQGKITATNISDLMKYRASFSREKAEAAAPAGGGGQAAPPGAVQAAPARGAAPAAAPPAELSPAERLSWVFLLAQRLFADEGEGGREAQIDFDLAGMGRYRLVVTPGGARAEKDPPGEPSASVVRADPALLCDLVDGKADAAAAFAGMKAVATRMADFLFFADRLRSRDYLKVVAEAVADAPVKAPAELMGKTVHGNPLVVRRDHGEAYATATGSANPRYFGGGETPPLLAVRYHFDLARTILTDPALELDIVRLVHGEQEMVFHKPIRPLDVIAPKAAIHEVVHKEAGSIVTVRYMLWRDGELVNETYSRYFVRREDAPSRKGQERKAAGGAIERPDFETPAQVAADQSLLYAAASLDRNPIHTDENVAKAAGFRTTVLQGLCTLAVASNAVIAAAAGDDPSRLASIRARIARPVFNGDRLVTRGKLLGEAGGVAKVAFEVIGGEGEAVITGGLAEIGGSTKTTQGGSR